MIAQWTADDVKAGVTRGASYYDDYKKKVDKWADDIVKAAGVTGQKLTDLWNELWEQRMKLDIQAKEAEKITKSIADEIVKANPELAKTLASDTDKKSFTDAVESMGNQLVEAVQEKSEAATLNKAEAGIFSLGADEQKEYDDTQK